MAELRQLIDAAKPSQREGSENGTAPMLSEASRMPELAMELCQLEDTIEEKRRLVESMDGELVAQQRLISTQVAAGSEHLDMKAQVVSATMRADKAEARYAKAQGMLAKEKWQV